MKQSSQGLSPGPGSAVDARFARAEGRPLRVIVSGGGTGGHIYPAIAIADELKRLRPDTEFLFVGAEGKMEMEKVPMAGYEIVGLPIRGLDRTRKLRNLSFPFRLLSSLWKSRSLIKSWKPDVVIGTGGYAGGPILYMAGKMGVPTLIQEPNAFAGLANKWVGKHVDKICVAFPGMEKFFPKEKLVLTGNPVREISLKPARTVDSLSFATQYNTADSAGGHHGHILLMGGSGGARSMNEALRDSTELIRARPQVQWTWQCGKHYYTDFKDCATAQLPNVTISAFIDDMTAAYRKATIVIGRAGSTTIAETQFLGKPTVLVPSPWVAEDHQTANAKALVEKDAAILVADATVTENLVPTVFELFDDRDRLMTLSHKARKLAQPGAAARIAQEALLMLPAELQHSPKEKASAVVTRPKRILLHQVKRVYFIGVGGIGMSAVARYFLHTGCEVSGYDKTETPLTQALEAEGVKIHYGKARPDLVPEAAEDLLVVWTPAIPSDFAELVKVKAGGYYLHKRAEVLGLISEHMQCVGIAGTHGKTTTTTITTHLMVTAGLEPHAFLGGIPRNFAGNYVAGGGQGYVVVEADEYDRSFLQLHPSIAVILSADPDHLDIYGDHENMLETGFRAYARRVKPGGELVVRHDIAKQFTSLPNLVTSDMGDRYHGPQTEPHSEAPVRLSTFGIEVGDYCALNIRVEDGSFYFDLKDPNGGLITDLRTNLPGRHNVENAVAACAVTLLSGGTEEELREGLATFKGIARRFETLFKTDKLVIIDDYAHHPTELDAAINAARELYPNRKITGAFQPHLFSRTNDFAPGFAKSLDALDEIVLIPIYPAREEPMPGVTSQLIYDQMENPNRQLLSDEDMLRVTTELTDGVLLLLGAGDIDALIPKIVAHHQNTATHD